MKLKTPKPAANFWIIAGTLGFFILSYFIYLDYYVPKQESEIISTRFRVLDQLGDNINAKIESYEYNVLSLEDKIADTVSTLQTKLLAHGFNFTKEEIAAYIINGIVKSNFSGFLHKDLEVVGYKLDLGGTQPSDQGGINLNKTEISRYFYFNPLALTTQSDVDGKIVEYHDTALVRVSYDNILNGLKRDDVFDETFIIRKGEFIFSTLKADMLIEKSSGDEDIMKLLFTPPVMPKPDEKGYQAESSPILSLPQHLVSGQFTNLTISNKEYKLFFKPIKVEDEYWFLGGLMESGNFFASGRSIPQRMIVVLSWLLILIVLGLPLIKIKIISKTEHLKSGTIVNSALAILLGASVLTMFVLYLAQNKMRLQNADKRLINLSAEIDSTFNGEIKAAFNQLKETDLRHEDFDTYLIPNIINLPAGHPANPKLYPFADYIFWIDKKGMQSTILSVFKDKKSDQLNLRKRAYFTNKDEWFFPPDPKQKFRLESILSWRTSEYKVAISTSSEVRNNPVIALTSRFYSLIDPILPKNFDFCIIDKDGEVWFHSVKYRNTMENFLDECNGNYTLKAALYNRTTIPLDVTYYNKNHRAFIKPLNNLPLYLVTLYNKETESSFQSQVFIMAIGSIVVFLLFLLLQISVLMILERHFRWKLAKNLVMKITRPRSHHEKYYRFLIMVYFLVSILTAIGLNFTGKIESVMLVFMVEIIVFVFSYKILNDNELKEHQTKWFTRINYAFLIILNLVLLFLSDLAPALIIMGCQLLLIFSLNIIYRKLKPSLEINERNGKLLYVKYYVLFLLSIALLFAILPTLVFYELAYNKESEIRLRHFEVDLMKKRENRNNELNKYYASLLDTPEAEDILKDRKNRGVYTQFVNGLTFSHQSVMHNERELDTRKVSVLDSLFYFVRPYFDDEIIENKFLIYGSQTNNPNQWINYDDDSLVLKYVSNTEDPRFARQDTMRISGMVDKFSFITPVNASTFTDLKGVINNIFYWLFLLFIPIILFLFYYLVRFAVYNIYSINVLAYYTPEPFWEMMRHKVKAKKSLILVKLSPKDETPSLPDDIKTDLRLDWSKMELINESEKLLDKLADELKKTTGIVYINHFDWAYLKPDIMIKKIEIILKFIHYDQISWIIQSSVSPVKIIEYYQELINLSKNSTETEKEANKNELDLYNKLVNDLQKLINISVTNQLPVRRINTFSDEDSPYGLPGEKFAFESLINKELYACDYLEQYRETMTSYYKDHIKGKERQDPELLIVDKLNTLADGFYEDLFNSCTPEEQYALFDLAGDLIINQKNTNAIYGLLDKGILVRKTDKISFMNFSFRRFLLTLQSKVGTVELELKIGKKSGTWKGYRIMFILIIASLFIFISLANQDFLKNLNQIFIVIGGGIASISGVLGLLSKTNKSTSQ